jgi:hypothetical protein
MGVFIRTDVQARKKILNKEGDIKQSQLSTTAYQAFYTTDQFYSYDYLILTTATQLPWCSMIFDE